MPFIKHVEPEEPSCISFEHNPPTHIVLDPGTHTWKCPECGNEQVFNVPSVRL